jgi:tRNA G37 N-methylase Trm5
MVFACEWNPAALRALRHNLTQNGCTGRCAVLEGDCLSTAPKVESKPPSALSSTPFEAALIA